MKPETKILFLCHANAGRSQMAEGLARSILGENYTIQSAGAKATRVHPFAIQVLQEIGIDISHHVSKSVDTLDVNDIDLVITLCTEQVCPVVLTHAKQLHWLLPDPYAPELDEENHRARFRATRDELRRRITQLKKELESSLTIALCGLGIAGQARLEALKEIPDLKLAGVVSRRAEYATLDWEEALKNPAIQAIAISTENTDHPFRVKQALDAGKHVLCDYPLAFDFSSATSFFELAKKNHRILHGEHMALLSTSHEQAKKEIEKKGALIRGEYLFKAGWNEKLADQKRTGPYPFLALSRLLQVADLFGSFEMEKKKYEVNSKGFYLELLLTFPNGARLCFVEDRKIGQKRQRQLVANLEKGEMTWATEIAPAGLFKKDLVYFVDRIKKGIPCYYSENQLMNLMGQLEKIS